LCYGLTSDASSRSGRLGGVDPFEEEYAAPDASGSRKNQRARTLPLSTTRPDDD
jgi:hypothetical protein